MRVVLIDDVLELPPPSPGLAEAACRDDAGVGSWAASLGSALPRLAPGKTTQVSVLGAVAEEYGPEPIQNPRQVSRKELGCDPASRPLALVLPPGCESERIVRFAVHRIERGNTGQMSRAAV